jgi:4-amino-4-deoxy-L-arabinose transferase-like glycosyltransferase
MLARRMSRARAYVVLLLVSALPRLAVALYERGDLILPRTLIDRNVFFAETFVTSGTFGYQPGVPSADTQPLYGFFLVPLYWLFDGSWLSIALAQTALAGATALVVYELGCRLFRRPWALVGALVATLNPYLVWHDVHVAREVLDGFLAAAIALAAYLAAERGSVAYAAAVGGVAGLGILANARLALLPVALAMYVAVSRRAAGRQAVAAGLAVVAVSATVVAPWLVRNQVQVGCFTLTTNAEAFWKANNASTLRVLRAGKWIDDVPLLRAPRVYVGEGERRHIDECADMRFYQHRVWEFWREQPGEKARLAGQAVIMLWDPRARTYEVRPSGSAEVRPVGGTLELASTWGQGLFIAVLYALALVGSFRVKSGFLALALTLLAYQTVAAMVFAGTTRYRAPWDFLLALLATAGLQLIVDRMREHGPLGRRRLEFSRWARPRTG